MVRPYVNLKRRMNNREAKQKKMDRAARHADFVL